MSVEMANPSNFKDVKLGNTDNHASSTASSDFDRLEDCNEAEFRGATLSLSQENSPTNTNISTMEDANANIASNENVVDASRRTSSLRLEHRSEVQDFFAIREGALQKAAEQCTPVILENLDGNLRGIWLLTEIDHWDTEKERMIFLTENCLISLKYDFITLNLLEYKRLPLNQFERIIVGELKYPEKSLMPARNQLGVQCSWNQTQPVPAMKRWNPWCREIPWITYTSHPLLKTETGSSANYDIEDFSKKLVETVENLKPTSPTPASPAVERNCEILYQPIVIECYAGIAAALHNANELGFFKSRGKVSF